MKRIGYRKKNVQEIQMFYGLHTMAAEEIDWSVR
jgi:hypothetical protein